MKKSTINLLYSIILSFTLSLIGTAQSSTVATNGVYVPRLTTAQRTAIATPSKGQMIYNTDDNCFNIYQNAWQKLCGFNVSTSDSWVQKANFGSSARINAVGFSIGSKGYIGTGNDGAYRKDFWEFDPATNAWTQKADFGGIAGIARESAVGFSIGSKGYLGTGNNGANRKDFWEYDPATNTWTQKTDFGGTARFSAVGFSIGNKGYIGTGNDGSFKKDFWEYNPVNNTWTQKTDFGGDARYKAAGFSIGSKGYVGIGDNGVFFPGVEDFWEYNQTNDIWTQKANYGGGKRHLKPVGFSIGNKGYMGTGLIDGGNIGYLGKKEFWEFDPASNVWSRKTDFIDGRENAVGFSIGLKGYIGMGFDRTNLKNDFWEFNPPLNFTQEGNTFNGVSQLVQTDANGKLLNSVLPTNFTAQGNTFNGANQLLKLDASGNLGIGTSLPHAALQFGSTSANRKISLWEDADNNHQFTGFGVSNITLRYQVSDVDYAHKFYAASSTTTSNELMTIAGNGNVRVGRGVPLHNFEIVPETTSHGLTLWSSGVHTHQWTFSVGDASGTLFLDKGLNQRGQFDPTSGAYSTVSDRRLKKNISDINNVIDDVMKLKPSNYAYIKDNPTNKTSTGLIAQEVALLFPQFVHKTTNDSTAFYAIDYAGMNTIVFKAIQEQQKMIDELKAEVLLLKKK